MSGTHVHMSRLPVHAQMISHIQALAHQVMIRSFHLALLKYMHVDMNGRRVSEKCCGYVRYINVRNLFVGNVINDGLNLKGDGCFKNMDGVSYAY